MAYSVVASLIAGSANGNDVVTSSIDTTGADLIAVVAVSALAGFGIALTDTNNNTWIQRTVYANSNSSVCIFYCHNPVVNASHGFTLSSTGSNTFCSIGVLAVSGSNASPYESESGVGMDGVIGTIQPGSLIPAESGCLLVTGLNAYVASTISIDSGFTALTHDYDPGHGLGAGIGWLIQGSAIAVNPTWTVNPGAAGMDAAMVVFKPAATGATSYTLVAPNPAIGSVGNASANFTVTPTGGNFTGTITPSDGGQGGTFTPSSLSWVASATPQTFTYTGASHGIKTISTTNSGSLTDPSSVTIQVYSITISPSSQSVALCDMATLTATLNS